MALTSSQTFTNTRELTLTCRSKYCHSAAYLITYRLPLHSTAPTHCPCCPANPSTPTKSGLPLVTTRPTDLADIIVLNNVGYTRASALRLLQWQSELVTYRRPGHTLSIQELMEKHGVATMKYPYAGAYTPLAIQCRDCGSTFTMLRGTPVAAAQPPTHCVWCGSTNVYIAQLDTEDAAWEALAAKHDLPIPVVKKFYNYWVQRNTHANFGDFMVANADDVDLVRMALAHKGKE